LGRLRRALLSMTGQLTWRVPSWTTRLLTSFSQAERGSAYDMLAACEQTERREMRKVYFHHALDESRHAGLFRDRVQALGGLSRSQAAVMDAAYLANHGIVTETSLFRQMGELEFLAFVHLAERDGKETFEVYVDLELPDPDTITMLRDIIQDEKFHTSYSKKELERYTRQGRGDEVKAALKRVKRNRLFEAWLRGSRQIGDVVSGLWLLLLYGIVVAPFRILARLDAGGWQPPTKGTSTLPAARSQA
jgi:rubrerythrin